MLGGGRGGGCARKNQSQPQTDPRVPQAISMRMMANGGGVLMYLLDCGSCFSIIEEMLHTVCFSVVRHSSRVRLEFQHQPDTPFDSRFVIKNQYIIINLLVSPAPSSSPNSGTREMRDALYIQL